MNTGSFKRSERVHTTEKIEERCEGRGQMTVNMVLTEEMEKIVNLCLTMSNKMLVMWDILKLSRSQDGLIVTTA